MVAQLQPNGRGIHPLFNIVFGILIIGLSNVIRIAGKITLPEVAIPVIQLLAKDTCPFRVLTICHVHRFIDPPVHFPRIAGNTA